MSDETETGPKPAPTGPESEEAEPRSWISRIGAIWTPRRVNGNGADHDHMETGETSLFALNAKRFDRLRVEDVMIPRADIIALEIDTPLGEVARQFAEAAHSRLPIYRETLDDPVGVAHIKDLIIHLAGDEAGSGTSEWRSAKILSRIRRPLLYVPPSMRASDLLLRMQSRRLHMALVVDEFGGTDGLVTLEDLLEPIVGDIEDEHDEEDAPAIRPKGPACWEADAKVEIITFEEAAGRPIMPHTDAEELNVDTLGGLVFMLAGRIPERGEVIRLDDGFEFEVLDADPRRIKRLRVKLIHPGTGSEAAAAPA